MFTRRFKIRTTEPGDGRRQSTADLSKVNNDGAQMALVNWICRVGVGSAGQGVMPFSANSGSCWNLLARSPHSFVLLTVLGTHLNDCLVIRSDERVRAAVADD